ncbi:TIGR04104 family putative zinc finger protein [Paucisalibacillus globulus]|uniref:TIGR04104 family putative zinc finger protein n=1 Tax=Paucisalibacillus globulus TaxID=351095 RepID=UPI000BB8B612
MKTPKCKSCNHHLEWKKVFTSLWFPQKTATCSQCMSHHEITTPLYISILTVVLTNQLALLINNFLSWSSIWMSIAVVIALIISLIILFSIFIPYFARCRLVD